MPVAPLARDAFEESKVQLGSELAKIDAGETTRRATRDFTQYQLPQLKSGIAARGNFYSTARQRAEKQATEGFVEGSYDIQSALQRQMDDLTRQRMYATLGIIL